MTVGTTVTNAQGAVGTNNGTGLQVQQDTNNLGFAPYAVYGITNLVETGVTQSVGGGQAGILTLSGSGQILTVSMSLASTCAGAEFIFRNLDARAHKIMANSGSFVLTGSTVGQTLTMPAQIAASVLFYSDGVHYCAQFASGTVTLA